MLNDKLMGQKVVRKMTLEAECWFYTRWVSVTSEFPLAPAGILSRHPERSQRRRMGVGEMEPEFENQSFKDSGGNRKDPD